MITRDLAKAGVVDSFLDGKEWRFRAGSAEAMAQIKIPVEVLPVYRPPRTISPADFERRAAKVLSEHFGIRLQPGRVAGVPKLFDLVSTDGRFVGDAKFYTLVQGERLPPAKFSVIAEHVWLLEKTGATERFLVFGNDRRVPNEWLRRYGKLASGITFYFIGQDETLDQLTG